MNKYYDYAFSQSIISSLLLPSITILFLFVKFLMRYSVEYSYICICICRILHELTSYTSIQISHLVTCTNLSFEAYYICFKQSLVFYAYNKHASTPMTVIDVISTFSFSLSHRYSLSISLLLFNSTGNSKNNAEYDHYSLIVLLQ